MSDRLIDLGKCVATHGIQGWLKIHFYNPKSTMIHRAETIVLEKGGTRSTYILAGKKRYKGGALVKFQGVDGVNQAKNLVGSTLLVAERALHRLREGEYYYYQAIGFDVFGTDGVWIGKVTRIWFKKGMDLYVVSGSSKEYLIPAVKEVIEKFDSTGGKIVISPPKGLLEL